MKRITGLILSLILLLSLAACGGSPEATEAPATQPAVTEAPTEAATEAPTEPDETMPALEMEETMLVDDENCAFSIHFASLNAYTGMELEGVCVNKTGKTLIFSWNNVSVCGYVYDPLWSQEVAPGETVNCSISIDTYQLEQYGVTSVDEITFTLNIFDSEDFMAEPYVDSVYTIYPTGLNAETVVYPDRVSVGGEQVVTDSEGVDFIIESFEDETNAYVLRCYLGNRTDIALMFAWEEVTVNGAAIDPMWAAEVPAGKRAYTEISFPRSQLEENGIEEVEQIDFRLVVSNMEDFEAENVLDDTFTFRAEDSIVG